jgi:hypothetical protein
MLEPASSFGEEVLSGPALVRVRYKGNKVKQLIRPRLDQCSRWIDDKWDSMTPEVLEAE